jgi:RNA polymerase sigma-70 factor, ECF subfamily
MTQELDQNLKLLLAQRALLIGYIRAIVGDPHLAEDVFQDVALVVVKKAPAGLDESHFSAWVRVVARYESLTALRKRHVQVPFDDALLDAFDGQWAEHAEAESQQSSVEALRACLDHLPPTSRRLVAAKYEREQTGEQIATELRKPLNTVYVTLSRIHKVLADCVRRRLAMGGADVR